MTLIMNPTATYEEVHDMSSGNEATCVQYDYARPTGVAVGRMEHVLLTPMYEPLPHTPCGTDKVSI